MTTRSAERPSASRTGLREDAIVLAVDAGSHGPRAVETLLQGISSALGPDSAPTFASTHVVALQGLHHVGALVWERPPWRLDLLALAHRVVPPVGATLCRMTRHGARLSGGGPATPVLVAAREAVSGSGGRVAAFPGQAVATGVVTVGDLLGTTALDAVVGLAGTQVHDLDVVVTDGWLRPCWSEGRLELVVERAVGGVLRPFEQASQIACCALH